MPFDINTARLVSRFNPATAQPVHEGMTHYTSDRQGARIPEILGRSQILSGMRDAITAPMDAWQGKMQPQLSYDEDGHLVMDNPAPAAAMNVAGNAMTGGFAAGTLTKTPIGMGTLGATAWHGSPHLFPPEKPYQTLSGEKVYVGGKAMSVPKDYMNDPRVIDAVSDLQARNDRLVAAGYKPRSIEQEQKKWAQIFEEKDLNNSELEYKQRSAERASKSPAYQFLNKDQIDSINQYSDRLDRNAEGRNQVINSIENEAKKRGLTIENVSQSKGGNSKSLYIRNSNNELIRVSDHELPMTPEREHNRAQGLMGKWDRDLVIDDWLNKSLDDHMDEIEQKQQPMSISD